MTALQSKLTRMTLLAVCSAALTAPLAVFAQDAPPPPPPPAAQSGGGGGGDMVARMQMREAQQLQMMTSQLSLTDAQVASIKQIFADRDAKAAAAYNNGGSQGDPRAQMMALRQESNAKIRALLTPDQQTKFDAMMQQMGPRGGMGGGRGGNGGGTPPPPPQQ